MFVCLRACMRGANAPCGGLVVRMRKDGSLLLIDCPVTCCDALNQGDSRPSVGSTQLLRQCANKPQQLGLGLSREISFYIYHWTDSSTSDRYTTSTLAIVIETFGNHSSNLAVSLYKQLQFVCASTHTFLISWQRDISLLWPITWKR